MFLTVEDVLALHGEQLERFGGSAGVRDRGALESAVAVPAATFDGNLLHEDLFQMAAAYAFHLADVSVRTGCLGADVHRIVSRRPLPTLPLQAVLARYCQSQTPDWTALVH